jgi:hypothetical protein
MKIKKRLTMLESIRTEWAYNDDGTKTRWHVHKDFGPWAVKFVPRGWIVLEHTEELYHIDWNRAHESDWVDHICGKIWGRPTRADLVEGLTYLRQLIAKLKATGVIGEHYARHH